MLYQVHLAMGSNHYIHFDSDTRGYDIKLIFSACKTMRRHVFHYFFYKVTKGTYLISSYFQNLSDMWQCPVKIVLFKLKVIHYRTKWPVEIWVPLLWSMWISCKLDAGSSNSYPFTGPNVHSNSIYLGKHWIRVIGAVYDFFLPDGIQNIYF